MIYWELLGISVLCWYGLPYLFRRGAASALARRCRKHRVICLTYDDGPSSTLTPRLIELFHTFGAKATFFPTGFRQSKHQTLVMDIRRAGHDVGSHSFTHLHAWKRNPLAVFRDIEAGLSQARQLGSCKLFRPPFGKVTAATLLHVWAKGFKFGWWTMDSSDTWDTAMAIDCLLQKIRDAGGGVVLMHDHSRPSNPEEELFVINLTEAILNMARNEKYEVCSMSELALR